MNRSRSECRRASRTGSADRATSTRAPIARSVIRRPSAQTTPGAGVRATVVGVGTVLDAGTTSAAAAALGPQWIRDVRAALPQAALVPTGGVRPDQVVDWLAAGAVACGVGSALTAGDPDAAAERIRALLDRIGIG